MVTAKTRYSSSEIDAIVDTYIQNHWEDVIRDLNTLVSIPSYREDEKALPQEGAPFGPGPRKALSAVLGIAQHMGFSTHDLDGYIGYADWLAEEPEQTSAASAANTLSSGAFDPNTPGSDASALNTSDPNTPGSIDIIPGQHSRNRQIGIIGHVDIVPAGPGWNFEPYAVTRKDGFLMGRGVADDKGPVIVALHAMNLWKQQGVKLPYDLRFLFGAAEETGMEDVDYYQRHFNDPDFLFTPDAEFPVCYGEKGHYDGTLISQPIEHGALVDIQGGTAPNAVPGSAFAIVRCFYGAGAAAGAAAGATSAAAGALPGETTQAIPGAAANAAEGAATEATKLASIAEKLPAAERITLTWLDDGNLRIDALGKCQHASLPEGGINAIGILVDYLLQNNLCSPAERDFLQLDQLLLHTTDGSGFGCACADEDFGALTMVGGMISFEAERIKQTIDCRFPTCISADEIENHIQQAASTAGAAGASTGAQAAGAAGAGTGAANAGTNAIELQRDSLMEPFLINKNALEVQTLLHVYNEITGDNAQPFTMGGGTYARKFKNAASFGPEKPWIETPSWVGGMHSPDEGVSEESLKEALRIYAHVLIEL